jgi:CRP-like cAMP-binding protein
MFSANQHSPLSFPIFTGCDSEDILRLEKNKKWLSFENGEYIFRENEPSNGIYCLSKGAVKIIRRDSQQEEKILSLAKEGDVLGLRAVIDKTGFSSSAVAIVDSHCCFVPKAHVYQIIEKHPSININIMLSLCRQINEIEQKITLISGKNILRRVAEVLLMLMQSYGLDQDNFIKVMPSWDDLANLANITIGTLIRALNEMQQKGWIGIRNRRIKIFNSHLLEGMAL